MPLRIVSLGDSIVWGQGLSEADKFDVLIRDALADANPGIALQRLAHSGAVIGVNPVEGSVSDGEVPMPQPTIIEQCDSFNDSPETVDLVLLDGGINDVDVRTILNPFAPLPILIAKTRNYCPRVHVGAFAQGSRPLQQAYLQDSRNRLLPDHQCAKPFPLGD